MWNKKQMKKMKRACEVISDHLTSNRFELKLEKSKQIKNLIFDMFETQNKHKNHYLMS